MGKIKVMSSHLANMIAAGEVIERPSSIIKELVENSIDAHAKHVEVRIYKAGRERIVVVDDGDGMDKEDAQIAFKRHASSKLLDEYDLFKIKTMGFRGEALPSIAAVSKINIMTSTGSGIGTALEVEEENITARDYPAIKGTTFDVRELFYNTPVRLKYLKSDNTEVASCLEVMQRLALSFTDVAFDFYIDEKLAFSTTGRGDLLEVISRIYSPDIAKKMVKISFEENGFEVNGYIGLPELTRSTRYYMISILNNRNVYIPSLQKAIIAAYSDFIFNSKYPFVILNLKVDYSLVDVNVHPSKREVRLSIEKELASACENAIKEKLRNLKALTQVNFETRKEVDTVSLFNDSNNDISTLNIVRPTKEYRREVNYNTQENLINTEISFDINSLDETVEIKEEVKEEIQEEVVVEERKEIPNFKVIGQIHKTYIVLEGDNGFYLVDQHAAMERINYERFNKILNAKIETTPLLVPLIIHLSPSEVHSLQEDKLSLLSQIGLEVEVFGINAVRISSIPLFIKEVNNEEDYILELINQVIKKEKIDILALRKHVIATMACKASIKANDKLEMIEMNDLIKRLFMCDNPTCCPHGRPTIIHFSQYDVEKLFKRSGI